MGKRWFFRKVTRGVKGWGGTQREGRCGWVKEAGIAGKGLAEKGTLEK